MAVERKHSSFVGMSDVGRNTLAHESICISGFPRRVVSFLLLLRVFLLDDVSDRPTVSFVSLDQGFSREIHHPVRCHRRVIVALDDE